MTGSIAESKTHSEDVEIGFIQGRSAIVTENSTNQSKALCFCGPCMTRLALRTEPMFIEE